MSSIEKLSIQGIRSFGSNSEDVQSIAFASPVTLILGENGCGKTTIIECLKYALTGETPPGSDRGKSFVHDPKIYSLSDTLAQIKLQVRNIRGERLSVCRSMKITRRRGKNTFETLDATVNYIGVDGGSGEESISKRCIDVDVAMCDFMGVSKAIMNNVLFCHQEDSSWPLDEAKKLKEKFDAIFGITEYNKAIEKIIKMRKEEMDDLKLKEANLRLLAHLKEEMEEKTLSLEKAQQKCKAIKEHCYTCDENMKPIDDRLLEIRNIEYEVGKFQALKVEMETKLKSCSEQMKGLRKNIRNVFEGSIQDLQVEIHTFNEKMSEKKVERFKVEEKLRSLKQEEKTLQTNLVEMDKKRCMLIQQRQCEQDCNARRANKIKFLCSQMKIALSVDVENTTDGIPEVLGEIQGALLSEQCQIAEAICEFDLKDQQYQIEIDTLRVNMAKLEEGVSLLQKQIVQYEKDSQLIESKISEIEVSAHRLKKITQEIERITEYYETMNGKLSQGDMRHSIAAGKEKVAQLQRQFRSADERLTFLHSIAKLMAEIKLKERELEKKEQEMRRVKNKHSDNFGKVFDSTVESNFKRTLQSVYEKLRREIKGLDEKSNAIKLKQQSYEIERKNIKEELVRFEKELEESKESIFEKCHGTPYVDLLAKSKSTLSKYQLDLGAFRSADTMYKKYMQKIREQPCCPLCHKNMSDNEAADITTELSDEIHQLPANIARAENMLKVEQTKYEGFLQLKAVIDNVTRLEAEIPKRKIELTNVQKKLAECINESESLQMVLVEPTANFDLANSMMGDMSLLDEAFKEESRLKDEISKLKSKLPDDYDENVSEDDVQTEKITTAAELENERALLDKIQHDYEKATEALNKLRDRKNALKDEQINLQEGVQSLPQLKERKTELSHLLETATIEVQEFKQKVQPLKQKLNAVIAEKARQKESGQKHIAQMQTSYDKHKHMDIEIQRLDNEMLEFQKLNLAIEIDLLKKSIKCNKDKNTQKSNEVLRISEQLDAIKTECLNHETLERDLKDNRELMLLSQKEIDLKEQTVKLSKQLGDLDFRKVSNEKLGLIKKRDEATVRKGELLGQIGEINNQISKLQKEMEQPKYMESMQNYRRADYEVEVTRRMISDLGQYRIALEWSLMRFHAEKMEKINRLIREYWRQIYRGNDIDYIQIQTDEANTTSADRRRSYNYRVIQSKNNSEIEMRGRCSAGQRVLASLIIRIALAETFSSNCGVLALDEPTTNLDRMNIISLCDALNNIVDERKSQSNFMLIIITHDEDFISTLGKIDSYYRVFRNDDCKSVIRKVKVA